MVVLFNFKEIYMGNRGGVRPGAGRPKNVEQTLQLKITLPISLRSQFKALGGSNWVQQQIIKANLNDE